MTGKATNEQEATARGAMSRRDMLKLGGGTLAGACILGLTGCGGAGSSGSKSLTVGNIGWDENVAVSNLTKILLLDDLGYDSVDLKLLDVGLLFDGVARGDLDTFQDVWLPKTHASYWKKYKDRVVDLGQWYDGPANLGLGVPGYVEAQSIADLNEYRNEFGGEITGIEPGSGIMKITQNDVIPGYNLDYTLSASSTPAMLAEVKRAINDKKPIVFTAWKPHWMFTAYNIRYLDDPKKEMGSAEQLSAIARKGLDTDAPKAYQLLDNIDLNEEQLGQLELAVKDAGDPEEGVRNWLKDNRDVVDSWIPS